MTSVTVSPERSRGIVSSRENASTALGTNGIKAAAKAFEAVFLRQMIANMRAPSLGESLFGSDAGNQFRDMSDARLADSMAGKFGIAALVEKQISK